MEFDQRPKSSTANGSTRETYDRSHLLASVDGNAEIAREIVALYVTESAGMISLTRPTASRCPQVSVNRYVAVVVNGGKEAGSQR